MGYSLAVWKIVIPVAINLLRFLEISTRDGKKIFHFRKRDERNTAILEDTHFFSFTSDGSTDIAGDEQESIFVRTAHNGLVNQWFVGFFRLETLDAQCILDTVVNGLKDRKVWHEDKIVAVGCDGASTNLGVKKGMVALLKKASEMKKNFVTSVN